MPHISVKLYAGKSAQQKDDIAQALTQALMAAAGCMEDAVSVSIQDIAPQDWLETVYKPDIIARPDLLYKKPGYTL